MRRSWGRWTLPVSLGFSDGVLNALILASHAVLHAGGVTMSLALRVSVVALLTAIFTVFVAEYAQLRAELRRAEHELNLTAAGRLAASRLGRAVRIEGSQAAAAAGACSFLGSLAPLLCAAMLTRWAWLSLILGVGALGALGAVLARAVHGNAGRWIIAMTLGGAGVTLVGIQLSIT